MIEITTLLLGLITGPRMVAFTAAPQVASVVFHVDGEVVAGVVPEEGDGVVRVPLGREMMPHRVTAVAYDEAGREIGRDDEWVNLPRPEIDAELVLHGDPWRPERASLVWEHLARRPVTVRRVEAWLDDRPLPVDDATEIPLPRLDAEVPHVLRLDATFSNGERIELARSFGGGAIDEVETRLVPMRLAARPGEEVPGDPAALAACLAAPEGVRAQGVEEGPGEVLVVQDLSAEPLVARLLQGLRRQPRSGAGMATYRYLLPLGEGVRLRKVWPVPAEVEHGGTALVLFPSTEPEESAGRGMISVLRERHASPRGSEQRLGEAVAVAGLLAYGSGRPAAVVLVVGPDPPDAGAHSPAAARSYLAALGVPLHVWSLGGGRGAEAWGATAEVKTYLQLENAVTGLRRALERQRLVWLSGVALPQDVRFADCACCQPAADG
ncbi:MAG TPA: hypothetical protein VF100_03930 [Thermoanaerobaculia bacterium]